MEVLPPTSDTEDALLRCLVKRLVKAVDPERILLFGSRAKGTATGESDLDLCVIAEMDGTRRERRRRLRELIRHKKNGPIDLLTYTPEEFAREKHLLNSVTYFIAKHGRTLYQKDGRPGKHMEEPSEEEHDDWVRRWFKKADRDLETVRRTLIDDPMPDVACYHAQQAAEKCLKGFLTARGVEVEKTHVLAKLLDHCTPLDDAFDELRPDCERLKGYAVEIRYPNDPGEPDAEEARATFAAAERVCAFTRERLDLDV